MLISSLAETKEELEEAIALVTRVYQKAGYTPKDTGEASVISSYLYSPVARTFCVRLGDHMVGTLSIMEDSPQGLPMQIIFADELSLLRGNGIQIAESGQFAIDREFLATHRGAGAFLDRTIPLALFKLVIHWAMRKNLDHLCIAVNPKHEAFYRWMGFERFGGIKAYPSVENAPGVAMKLNVREMKEAYEGNKPANFLVGQIFAKPLEEALLEAALLPRSFTVPLSAAPVSLNNQ